MGADSKCPECGAFAWVKDMKTNHQLANTVNMCAKMRMLIGADDDCGNSKNNMHANNGNNKLIYTNLYIGCFFQALVMS